MAKYTPGKWSADEGEGYIRSLSVPAAESRICVVQRNIEGNAPLIASAPEILEALKDARDNLQFAINDAELNGGRLWAETKRTADEAVERAEVVIAQAEGKPREDS